MQIWQLWSKVFSWVEDIVPIKIKLKFQRDLWIIYSNKDIVIGNKFLYSVTTTRKIQFISILAGWRQNSKGHISGLTPLSCLHQCHVLWCVRVLWIHAIRALLGKSARFSSKELVKLSWSGGSTLHCAPCCLTWNEAAVFVLKWEQREPAEAP